MHTRDAAFKTTADVGNTRELGLLGIDALGSTSEESLVHLLVTGNNHLIEHFALRGEDDGHTSLGCDDSLFITHIGNFNLGACWHIQGKMAVKVGSDAVLGIVLLNDRRADDRFIVLVEHGTTYLSVHTQCGQCHDKEQE